MGEHEDLVRKLAGAVMALPRMLKEISFGAGLNTRGDERAQPEELLDIGVNVEFDDVGDLRCRFPFDNVRTALVGGGTLADARKFAMHGDELVCFTSTSLYSWVPALSAWEYRGEHLAVATDEETVFATPGDQDYADRAELNGHVVYCWQTAADGVRIAVRDKATGAIVQPPTTIRPSSGFVYVQPRLVALDGCVMLFWINFVVLGTTTLMAARITVDPYTYTVAGSPIATVAAGVSSFFYDVCRIPGQDRCYVVLDGSGAGSPNGYTITSVDSTFAGAQTAGTVPRGAASSVGPIAIAVSPDAAFCTVVVTLGQVVYAYVWNVTGAGVPLTAVAAATDVALDATGMALDCSQVTAAYRLTQDGGHYRCYVFWTWNESDTAFSYSGAGPANIVFSCRENWIDATGATGGMEVFVAGLGLGARAFARDAHVYLVGTFAGLSFSASDPSGTFSELQNTYYLYRDDGFLVAKAVWGEGGGFHVRGWLPNVAADAINADAMVFMGSIRRIVPVGKDADLADPTKKYAKNYAERAPRQITFRWDDNRARRCLQFGETMYVLGGLVLQYDGAQLVELGTCSYPWEVDVAAGSSGTVAAAGYSYKATDRWTNGKGETDRSTTGTVANFTLAAPNSIKVSAPNLHITRKADVAIEFWRTAGNPVAGAPFFLVTSQDPGDTSGNNDYVQSNTTPTGTQSYNLLASVTDNLSDAALEVLTANPENNSVLASIEPPPASIGFTDSQRVFLAGIPGYPNTVYYSKYRQPGLVAAFNDGLTFDTPAGGGAITAIDVLDGVLIVWCETATYAFAGAGFDDTGGGSNFSLARIISKDLGCVAQEACALTDDGFFVKTNKGWKVLDRTLTYQDIGAGPHKYDAEPVYAMAVLTDRHQVRILTSGRMLVFDTLVKKWAESSISDGLDMLLWNGTPSYLTATGVRAENSNLNVWTNDYTLTQMDVELGWIKFGGMQSRAIVDFVQLLGELRTGCKIRVRLAKDYEAVSEDVWNYHTDKTWTPYPGTIGSALQLKQGPRWRRCQALKARFTVTHIDGVSPLTGPCVRLTSIAMPFALEPNPYSALAPAQKQ